MIYTPFGVIFLFRGADPTGYLKFITPNEQYFFKNVLYNPLKIWYNNFNEISLIYSNFT